MKLEENIKSAAKEIGLLEEEISTKVEEKQKLQVKIDEVKHTKQTIEEQLEKKNKAIQGCQTRIDELSADNSPHSPEIKEGTSKVYLCFKYV